MGEALSIIPGVEDEIVSIVMTRNQYVVMCNNSPAEGQQPYPAILLKVLDGG